MVKKTIAVLFLLVLGSVICPGTALQGRWKCGSSVIEFHASGTHHLKRNGQMYRFTVSGSHFVVQESGKKVKRPFRLAGSKLRVTFGEETRVYRKR